MTEWQTFPMSPASPGREHQVLVLWDIDHTLIETRGVGFAIYQRAFPRATGGRKLEQLAQIAGRTELDIMRETLRVNDIEPTDDAVAALAAELVAGYDEGRAELATTGRALPGAEATLRTFAELPQVHQSVLTGNLRDIARIKLETFGLAGYLDLASGAYGDDHSDRADLVAIAQLRAAERRGVNFDGQRTVLLGDTPKDVRAATTAGVRVIAVATGKTTPQELVAAGASMVVDDLADSDLIVELILGSTT